jgi:hypothetical protein
MCMNVRCRVEKKREDRIAAYREGEGFMQVW